jgi:hypothetical protein
MSEMTESAAPPREVSHAPMSPLGRVVALYTRPGEAWGGIRERAHFWFPLVVMMIVSVTVGLLLHHRAIVPTMSEVWYQQVDEGQMTEAQVEGALAFMEGPAGLALSAVQQAIGVGFVFLVTALIVWFGAGFVLGTGMKYRHALEVAAWSSFIQMPALILTTILAWFQQNMRGVHVGFGALLPAMETPTKLGVALRTFLDALGPLAIWYVVVGVIGAAALSGAPRKSVAWVLGALYLAMVLFMSAMAALFTPGA